MILYIHGFGSSAFSTKAKLLKQYFGEENILIPSLPYIPNLAVDTLEQIIKIFPNINLIGASLGGYYSIYLADKYNLKSVVINPTINPHLTLKQAVPQGISYYDNSRYDFKESYLNELENMRVKNPNLEKSYLFVQGGDEVLDSKESLKYFKGGNILFEKGGNHGFENFETKIDIIDKFFNGIQGRS